MSYLEVAGALELAEQIDCGEVLTVHAAKQATQTAWAHIVVKRCDQWACVIVSKVDDCIRFGPSMRSRMSTESTCQLEVHALSVD
eukprot:6204524-Amphidinium_carterae.1